jgi:putative ABC transport system permease protein
MIRNYLKVALRNILKYKFYSAINILGMTIGITACLLIIIYVSDELSYDRFHAKADRIYQVNLHGKIAGQDLYVSNTCPPLASALLQDVPGVEDATRMVPFYGAIVKNEDKVFTERKVYYADANFFNFFSFKLLEGDPATALKEPNSVVLTRKMAEKYFGTANPVGKILVIGNDNKSFKVTGVAENPPGNSHFIYALLISSTSADYLTKNMIWLNNFMYTYFLLRENASLESVQNRFNDLVTKYVGPEIEKFMGTTLKQMKEQGGIYGFYTIKLTDIHLHPTSQGEPEPDGNIMYVYFFGAVGIFIIFIACINFMNLSTARSAGRAKEVGLRKTLGSLRGQMIWQFLAESLVYSFITVLLALAACSLLLPYFNLLSGKELGMQVLLSSAFIMGIIGLILFVGLIAGSYPAFYLTSFSPVEVLKGKVRAGMKSKGVRSTLVVSQFALSIFLIIFTAVVYKQIIFMQDRDLGIDKKSVLIINNVNRLAKNGEAFKNAVDAHTGIIKSSYSANSFPGVENTTVLKAVGSDQDHIAGVYYADYDHQELMKFEMKSGRYFSRDFPSDSSAIVINEAAVKEFGYDKPLEEEIQFNDNNKQQRLRIIGVFKDFNFESLKSKVRPLAIRLTKNADRLMIRYSSNPKETVATLEKIWKQQAPNEPFDYSFLDENFDELFRSEQRMSTIFSIFSGLAIFIACLGLFALAAFTSEQRTKEIGIRKAMGASVWSLTILLSKEFTRLVVIAFVPAALVAWYVSNQWLLDFEYRTQISPLLLMWSGLGAVAIAWITVSYQSIKTALANPVNSLRYE